jgi:hypothetical protein
MGSAWEQWKKNNTRRQETGVVRPWDFVNPDTEYVTKDEEEKRYDICKGCDKLTVTNNCKECGCFMPAKVKLKYAECPIGKWGVKP